MSEEARDGDDPLFEAEQGTETEQPLDQQLETIASNVEALCEGTTPDDVLHTLEQLMAEVRTDVSACRDKTEAYTTGLDQLQLDVTELRAQLTKLSRIAVESHEQLQELSVLLPTFRVPAAQGEDWLSPLLARFGPLVGVGLMVIAVAVYVATADLFSSIALVVAANVAGAATIYGRRQQVN